MYAFLYLVTCGWGLAGEVVPFDSPRWEFSAQEHRIEEHLGRQSLHLKGGIATLRDSVFRDGIIEFDLAMSGKRGFLGGIWRVRDKGNYEDFYIRPHQSGNPDANQYTPVFNGLAGWQLYHGPGYGMPVSYRFGAWFHVKIVVSGQQAEIYIEDMDKPALFVPELKHALASGKVGLKGGPFLSGWFSNFSFQNVDKPILKGSAPSPAAIAPGIVTAFSVSDSFSDSLVSPSFELSSAFLASRSWTRLAAERSGIANLARIQGLSANKNTTLVRLVIEAKQAGVRQIDFGYSDSVRFYQQGKLVYSGNNRFRTRDYRYLGTMGFFDSVYVSLKGGSNELYFAVSEAFGGWGFQARIANREGIRILAE